MSLPSRPLTGGDFFAAVMDYRIRRMGGGGNVCRLFARLGGRVDAEKLESAMRAHPDYQWLAGAKWKRRFGIGRPSWILNGAGADKSVLHSANAIAWPSETPSASQPSNSNSRINVSLTESGDETALMLEWNHGVMDARGAELLLASLGGDAAVAANEAPHTTTLMKAQEARAASLEVDETCVAPILSFAPPRASANSSAHHLRVRFNAEQTARIDDACEAAGAGIRRSLYFIAACIRALEPIRATRGVAPAAWLVPVPMDLRKRGATGPIFSNRMTFVFYRVEATETDSIARILGILTAAQKKQLVSNLPQRFASAMQFSSLLPTAIASRLMESSTRGKMATFYFSDVGEGFTQRSEILGVPVLDIAHVPPLGTPPGIGFVFNRTAGCQAFTFAFDTSCISESEAVEIRSRLAAELGVSPT